MAAVALLLFLQLLLLPSEVAFAAAPRLLQGLGSQYEVAHLATDHFETVAKTLSLPGLGPARDAHPSRGEFRLVALGQELHVRYLKNTGLFSSQYREQRQTYDAQGNRLDSGRDYRTAGADASQNNCFYSGHVLESGRKVPGSWVAVDTCDGGFRGLISNPRSPGVIGIEHAAAHLDSLSLNMHLGRELRSSVQNRSRAASMAMPSGGGSRQAPNLGSLHLAYWVEDYQDPTVVQGESFCTVGTAHPADDHHHRQDPHDHEAAAIPDNLDQALRATIGMRLQDIGVLSTTTSYIELLVVNDLARYNIHGPSTEINSAQIVNIVDALYQNNNWAPERQLRVRLIGQVTFQLNDPWTLVDDGSGEVSVSELLSKFHAWGSQSGNTPAHDNRQLFSGLDFEGSVLGYANVGSMCQNSHSGGIDMTLSPNLNYIASVAAHEIGHNLGMNHDSSGNSCPSSGYIMNAIVTMLPPDEFSTCSVTYYNNLAQAGGGTRLSCLHNEPTRSWGDPVCGNGFVEAGEDCDCGTQMTCPCCEAATCKFATGAACSPNQPCCTNTCEVVAASDNQVCRASTPGQCDMAEVCDGVSADCPRDVVFGPGTRCTDPTYGRGSCFDGFCTSLNSDCSRQTVNGFTWTGCSSAYDRQPDGFCKEQLCQRDTGGGCSYFTGQFAPGVKTPSSDGVPCREDDSSWQCRDGKCVESYQLNPSLIWEVSGWSSCDSCDVPQTQTRQCRTFDESFVSIRLPDEACSPTNRPATHRKCLNVTLNCVHDPNENPFANWGRRIADRYDALDKAETLRSLIPRFSGYPSEFDADDDQYIKGIWLLMFYGFFFAFLGLVVWVLMCLCRKRVNADERADSHQKRPVCLPYLILLLFGVFIVVFTALGFFWNHELDRGVADDQVGATKLMLQIIDRVINKDLLLQVSLGKINTTAPALADTVGPQLDAMADDLNMTHTAFRLELQQLEALLLLPLAVTASHAVAGPPLSMPCVQCETVDPQQVRDEVDAQVTPEVQGVVDSASANYAALMAFDDGISNDPNLHDALDRLDYVRESAMKRRTRVAKWSETSDDYEGIRWGMTIGFLVLPLVNFLIYLVVFLRPKAARTLFSWSWHLAYCLYILMMVLFAITLPLAAVTGDSCKYLSRAERNVSGVFEVSETAGRILESCLLSDTSMLDATNLTSLMLLSNNFGFRAVPAFGSQFDLADLDDLATAVSGFSLSSMYPSINASHAQDLLDDLNGEVAGDPDWDFGDVDQLNYTDYDGSSDSFRLRHLGQDLCMGMVAYGSQQYAVGQACSATDSSQLWRWELHQLVHVDSGDCLELQLLQGAPGVDPGTERLLPANDTCDGVTEYSADGLTPCQACITDCPNGERLSCSPSSNTVCEDIAPALLVPCDANVARQRFTCQYGVAGDARLGLLDDSGPLDMAPGSAQPLSFVVDGIFHPGSREWRVFDSDAPACEPFLSTEAGRIWRAQHRLLTYLDASNRATTRLGQLQTRLGQLQTRRLQLEAAFQAALADIDGPTGLNQTLMELGKAGTEVQTHARCGDIGAAYQLFKVTWCETITTSLSFLALAFFMIAVSSVPVVVLSIMLRRRFHTENNKLQGPGRRGAAAAAGAAVRSPAGGAVAPGAPRPAQSVEMQVPAQQQPAVVYQERQSVPNRARTYATTNNQVISV